MEKTKKSKILLLQVLYASLISAFDITFLIVLIAYLFFKPKVFRVFYDNGKIQSQGNYKIGTKHGNRKEWFDNGELKSKGTYNIGEKTGTWKYWDNNGNLVKICKNGEYDCKNFSLTN